MSEIGAREVKRVAATTYVWWLFVGFVLGVVEVTRTTEVRRVYSDGGLEWLSGNRLDFANDVIGLGLMAIGIAWFWRRCNSRTERWLFGLAAIAIIVSVPLALQGFTLPKPGPIKEVYASAAFWVRIAGVMAASIGVYAALSRTHERAAWYVALAPVVLFALLLLFTAVLLLVVKEGHHTRPGVLFALLLIVPVAVPAWLVWKATHQLKNSPPSASPLPARPRLVKAGAYAATALAIGGCAFAIASGPSALAREFALCGGGENHHFEPYYSVEFYEEQRQRIALNPEDGVARAILFTDFRTSRGNAGNRAWLIENCPHSVALTRNPHGSRAAWERIVERYPNDIRLLLNAGAMNYLSEPLASVGWLERAQALGSDDYMLPVLLSTAYVRAAEEHPEQREQLAHRAIEFARSHLRADPSSHVAHRGGEAALMVGDDEAQLLFGGILVERGGDDAHFGHTLLGLLDAKSGDLEKAEAHLLKSAEQSPGVSYPQEKLAALLLDLGRHNAVKEYMAAVRNPDSYTLKDIRRRLAQGAQGLTQ